jgi:hypothetical protein
VETISREKATSDPGSVGASMSGVVVEVRVKEGQEIMKGDPLCGKIPFLPCRFFVDRYPSHIISDERNEGENFLSRHRRILS